MGSSTSDLMNYCQYQDKNQDKNRDQDQDQDRNQDQKKIPNRTQDTQDTQNTQDIKFATIYDSFKIYPNSSNIGIVESSMNSMIFRPPVASQGQIQVDEKYNTIDLEEQEKYPKWMDFKYVDEYILVSVDSQTKTQIKVRYQVKLAFFVMHPKVRNDSSKYILWSHGNASDLMSTRSLMTEYYELMNGKCGIIAYDYEGYGYSSGIHTEHNCYNDLTIMVAHATQVLKIKKSNLLLIGQSLGTGIVVDFCHVHKWTTPIVLISPYKSIVRVVTNPKPDTDNYTSTSKALSSMLSKSLSASVDSIDMFTTHHKIDKLLCDIMIFHGKDDNLILPEHSIEMYKKNKNDKDKNDRNKISLHLIDNADHNNIVNYIAIDDIVQKTLS